MEFVKKLGGKTAESKKGENSAVLKIYRSIYLFL